MKRHVLVVLVGQAPQVMSIIGANGANGQPFGSGADIRPFNEQGAAPLSLNRTNAIGFGAEH
jgi:hypothetical protein